MTIRQSGFSSYLHAHVIDQVGKGGVYPDMPASMVSGGYLAAEVCSRQPAFIEAFDSWIAGVHAAGDQRDIMELFAVESRCARWAAQAIVVNSLCGIVTLNLFNCGQLIEDWLCISRDVRRKKVLHQAIFARIAPELLQYSFPGKQVGVLQRIFDALPRAVRMRIYFMRIMR